MTITLQKIYADFRNQVGEHEVAKALLGQADWFSCLAEFDPKTGEALPQSLSHVLAKVARYSPPSNGEPVRDRLWRITEHSRPSVFRLFQALNESPRRKQALLPVHAVRELDAGSFIKLSNRPGRNIREKLAGNPYLQASRRFQSVDLPENRLLKEFATRLTELLELRLHYLGEKDDDLLPRAQSWLRSDGVQAIAKWQNLPPNNTLLAHRDYRRVWDAWRWLQTLDQDIARDLSQLEARRKTILQWTKYAQMWTDGGYLFAETPILFDYEMFKVRPWFSQVPVRKSTRKRSRTYTVSAILDPVCVDLSVLRPNFATPTESSKALGETYFWQHWDNGTESVDIELFNSDAACLRSDATSIAVDDLLFSNDKTSECLERSARAFASRLRGVFKHETLIWLVPDSLNEFDLEVTRRNLNARFADAKPLPRSVAAAFEQVDFSKIKRDGFPIVVVDRVGGKACITKLFARYDPKLSERLPETSGFYWERCPSVMIATGSPESNVLPGYDLITVNDQGQWRDAIRPPQSEFIASSVLKADSRVGEFAFCINLADSPVLGGIRLHSLQQRAGDIPLWRDRISELSIKLIRDGRYQRFHLVSRGTTVKPVRGLGVSIPVDENFTLPAGRPFYQFPLFRGDDADELGFSARLDSPVFPLKENVVCKLNLTFEYGADEPYKLVFIPLDKSFSPVRATWRKTEKTIIADAPWPDYPKPLTWRELQYVAKRDSDETSDLLDWVLRATDQIDRHVFRTSSTLTSDWEKDEVGHHFTYVRCNETDNRVLLHENNFAKGYSYQDFKSNDKVSFELQNSGEDYFGMRVAGAGYAIDLIRKQLYFPVITVWRDGRSIRDPDCPPPFANDMRRRIEHLGELLQGDANPNPIQKELLFLLSCMHKDAPPKCTQWIAEEVENGRIRDPQAVGFALGDLSEQFQKNTLATLLAKPTSESLSVFAFSIWREKHFVEMFNYGELQAILNHLVTQLGEITDSNRGRDIVAPLELLLGLLRTRASSDRAIKMLLQPHQDITKELANQVERISEIVARSNIQLYSFVQINIKKPDHERGTPDLLYALRLYLTGDDGANAIHITSVSDSDYD
jgi:hypothetical protein